MHFHVAAGKGDRGFRTSSAVFPIAAIHRHEQAIAGLKTQLASQNGTAINRRRVAWVANRPPMRAGSPSSRPAPNPS